MTLSTQFITMLAMIGMGCFFGAALDTHNRFLRRSKRKSWIVFLNDVLFWLMQGLLIFYVLFSVNMGELRFYIFIALFCGYAAYQSLFKRMYQSVLEAGISLMRKIYTFLVMAFRAIVIRPLQLLAAGVWSLAVMTGRGLSSLVKWLLAVLLWCLKILLSPIKWLMRTIWKFLPKKIKKTVDKIYKKLEGILLIVKNYFLLTIKWLKRFINKK